MERQQDASNASALVCASLVANGAGFVFGNTSPICSWIGAGLAVLLALAAIFFGARSRSGARIFFGVVALIVTLPVLFLSALNYACAVQHSGL
ncbi:MAG TPA: hypothetical protein VG944_06450 [Fimbriimonas sp.]|nr:hypothetical protein [Fimbriimonas sp.]